MIRALRQWIGSRLFYWGYRILPMPVRLGVSTVVAIGNEWATRNKADMIRAMNGERIAVIVPESADAPTLDI